MKTFGWSFLKSIISILMCWSSTNSCTSSKKKYSIPYSETLEFIERAILPYVDILTLGLREYMEARRFIVRHGLPPSDALHAATTIINNLDAIASEDKHFDKAGIKRIWIE